MLENKQVLVGLQRRWVIFALTSGFFVLAGFTWLLTWWQPIYARRWVVFCTLVFVCQLKFEWDHLGENRREGEVELLPSLGAGNIASLIRGVLIAALYGFLLSPLPEGWRGWLPGFIYMAAVLLDSIDGTLARLANQATRLGAQLDMFLDGLGMLAVTMLLVQYGQVPRWYVLIGLVRYIFLIGMWLRQRLGKPNYSMPASSRRRGLAAIQMGFVAVLLWPLLRPPLTYVLAYIFGPPLLVSFLWDWLYVSGIRGQVDRPG
jgi:CDP-diacylglycerol---glycerol-3-phosphate 3-phosphatidyltransferase